MPAGRSPLPAYPAGPAPEQFAAIHVRGRTEHASRHRRVGIVAVGLMRRRLFGGGHQRLGIQPLFPQDGAQRVRRRDIPVLAPFGRQDGLVQGRHGQASRIGRDHEARGLPRVRAHVGRRRIDVDAELAAPARQLGHPVGLALGRALAQQHAAGACVDIGQVHRQVADARLVARRQGLQPVCAQIGPVGIHPEVIVDGLHVVLRSARRPAGPARPAPAHRRACARR